MTTFAAQTGVAFKTIITTLLVAFIVLGETIDVLQRAVPA